MSVMNGFRAKLLDSILGIDCHINVYFDRNINSDYCTVSKSIEKIPGILKATPMTNDHVIIVANGKIAGSVVRGVSTKDLLDSTTITNNVIIGDVKKFDEGIIIGARLAEALNVDYGDKITFISSEEFGALLGEMPRMKKYKVIAIFDMGMFEYDNTLIYMPLKSAQAFFNYENRIKNIEVLVYDVTRAGKLADAIEKEIGMKAESWQSQQSHYFSALKTERNVMFLILTLIIVVAAFNIISNLMMIVQEKKSAIAIMRTFGATSGRKKIFDLKRGLHTQCEQGDSSSRYKNLARLLLLVVKMKNSLLRETKFDNHINSIKPLISELDDPEIENAVNELESLKEEILYAELYIKLGKIRKASAVLEAEYAVNPTPQSAKMYINLNSKGAERQYNLRPNYYFSYYLLALSSMSTVFIVASDRGLCGNFNSSIIKFSQERVNKSIASGKKVDIVFLGKKAFDIGKNRFDSKSILKIENSKGVTLKHVEALVNGVDLSKYDKVTVFYSKFYNTFTQKPMLETIKPWGENSSLIDNSLARPIIDYSYEYEPQNIEFILKYLVQDYVVIALYSALLESATSENSARMVAMESANRNTKEMLNKLELLYNRSRQAAISTDLIEVIGGTESL
ncbi:unnamed protein product [Parnassius apollo]|uniref:(apollo) hypothetical protein n=1 Tax=Parnassius apollo TaxID=110799 RepID=A0A8S3Y8W4_PARAO|nr:unnamed protein product [Parnassius apollo]